MRKSKHYCSYIFLVYGYLWEKLENLNTEKNNYGNLICKRFWTKLIKNIYNIKFLSNAVKCNVTRDLDLIVLKSWCLCLFQLSPIPEMYLVDLYEIICSMLEMNSENRPSITQLLLNEYVRRYILLILQDNCKRWVSWTNFFFSIN